MSKHKWAKLQPYALGSLPADGINKAIGTELEPGEVVMSVKAHDHARARHPADFARCFPHLAAVITNPLYVRDDFNNPGKIELVGRPEALGDFMLVAVSIEVDSEGRYHVASFYPISAKKVENRRDHLKRVLP